MQYIDLLRTDLQAATLDSGCAPVLWGGLAGGRVCGRLRKDMSTVSIIFMLPPSYGCEKAEAVVGRFIQKR